MKDFRKLNLKNKTVLVRCDFNVAMNKDGEIVDDFRIMESLPTIKYLKNSGAKVVLISHMGRPKNKISFKEKGDYSEDEEIPTDKNSLRSVHRILVDKLGKVDFVSDCVGEKVQKKISDLTEGDVLFLENLRYYKEEESCDPEFSKALSLSADIYINEAFSVSHRRHASIVGIADHLPSYAGLRFMREIEVLSRVKERPERPFVGLVGGAKISSKIKTIDYFMRHADHLLLGGKVANVILAMKNLTAHREPVDQEVKKKMNNFDLTSTKLHLPVDVIASFDPDSPDSREAGVGDVEKGEGLYDIGPETIEIFKNIIGEAKTIIWAGPLGFFEHENFEKGTREIGKIIGRTDALKIIGGGDTGYALRKFGLEEEMGHLSVGGGAMLAFISDESMPGLEALRCE